jgi:cation:H+ antiporter
LLPVVYVLGVRATGRIRERPMWRSVETPETRRDTPDEPQSSMRGMLPLALRFAGLAVVLGTAGWVISGSGGAISDKAGLSETTVGALFTSVATSTPELVTTLAAVRRGAVQLAVGGIIGGNSFDVLFLTVSDIAYSGDLSAAIGPGDVFWVGVGLAMTALLLLGLVLREKHGPAGIGFESAGVLGLYAAAAGVQVVAG